MRIGMVTACYKPVINGVTRMVSLYKAHMESLGHEVTVFTLGAPDPAGEEAGVIRSTAVPLGNSGYYLSTRYSNEAQARMRQMDIIHCHHLFMSVEMAHRYAHSPIVYTNHTRYDLYTGTYAMLPQPAADAVMRRMWPAFANFADVVIAPSEGVRQVMLDFGVNGVIEVIENGVDLRPFLHPSVTLSKRDLNIPETAVLLTYVGRLSAEKNILMLLRQFALAAQQHPELHLMLIGSGPLREKIEAKVRALQLEACVHIVGPVAYERLPAYLAAADIFVTASTSEVHPLTVIEAMAAGLPVVGIHSPGISDIVQPGVTGLLAQTSDNELAMQLLAMAQNGRLRTQMAQSARHSCQRFDISNTVAKTLALYERLLQERPDLRRSREHGHWFSRWQLMPNPRL